MKKLFLPFLFLSFVSVISQNIELKLVSDIWPPFSNIEGEKSIASDLVDEALRRQNIETSTEMISFSDVISRIKEGKFDGSAALWKNDEREIDFIFSDPYLNNQLVLVGLKDSDVGATSFRDLTGKKLGVIENYAYGDINARQNIILIPGSNNQQNLERLISGEIDYMLVDALIIQYLLKFQLNDVTKFLEIGQNPLLVKSLHFVISKNTPNAEQIILKFNTEIKNMVTDGTYHEILELNWIKMDIDGDGSLELVLDGNRAGTESPKFTYGIMMELSYEETADTPKRYYIDGNLYEDWEKVPKTYKMEIPVQHEPRMEDSLIRFGF